MSLLGPFPKRQHFPAHILLGQSQQVFHSFRYRWKPKPIYRGLILRVPTLKAIHLYPSTQFPKHISLTPPAAAGYERLTTQKQCMFCHFPPQKEQLDTRPSDSAAPKSVAVMESEGSLLPAEPRSVRAFE